MSTVIVLGERLDAGAATYLERAFEATLDGDVTLDAAGVTHLGGQGLELLICGAKTAAAAGRTITIADPAPAFAEHLRVFGMDIDDLQRAG